MLCHSQCDHRHQVNRKIQHAVTTGVCSLLNEMFYSIIMFPMLALISQYKGNVGTTSIIYTVAGLRHHREKK